MRKILLAQHLRPVFVCLVNIAFTILIPYFLYILIEIQIEFPIHNGPCFRINVSRGATAYGICSVAAVLRGVAHRILLEHCPMSLTAEKPLGIVPFERVFFLSFLRMPEGKVGHGIVTLEGDTIGINIYGGQLV